MRASEIIDWLILAVFGMFFAFVLGLMNQRTPEVIEIVPPVIVQVSDVDACKKIRECRNLAIGGYFEARGEPDLGVVAVMSVVLNRKNHEKWPNTVDKVLKYKCQFSYTCDGSLSKAANDSKQWERMYRIAYKLVSNGVPSYFQDLTHFHTTNVHPYWVKQFKPVATIGRHKFYTCKKEC